MSLFVSCLDREASSNFDWTMYYYVEVQFYPWFIFYFPLFWGVVMYILMSLKQRMKLNHNIYIHISVWWAGVLRVVRKKIINVCADTVI